MRDPSEGPRVFEEILQGKFRHLEPGTLRRPLREGQGGVPPADACRGDAPDPRDRDGRRHGFPPARRNTRVALDPPKPKEFETATESDGASSAAVTMRRPHAGSGFAQFTFGGSRRSRSACTVRIASTA